MAEIIPHRLKSQGVAFIHDTLVVPAAWMLAGWFRFNLDTIPDKYLESLIAALVIIIPVQAATFVLFGLYRGIWRFASLPDIARIIKAVLFGVSLSLILIFVLSRAEGIPRSVPVIYGMLLIMMLGGSRLMYRWLKDRHLYLSSGKRVLIVGAGEAGEMLARDMLRSSAKLYQPIAFVDDNARRKGREIHGIPILGSTENIPELVNGHDVELIMLAIPSASSSEIRRIVEICETTDVPFRTVPQLQDLMSGKVAINDLREISIEDLLGRDPVSLDWQSISKQLQGKRILVTGGGGSIGSELCRQINRISPEYLIILDNSEHNLYCIEQELAQSTTDIEYFCELGSVADKAFLKYVFNAYKPQIVFHAAAYKHVPLLESQIRQAIRNNVLGTRYVAEMADEYHVEEFILVSTDKAVNPSNIMGASKRLAEIFCQNLNLRSNTKFITVRFGNVLGSAGSVIPLFKMQIAKGGPVTVTDPRMERYFMTIPEACQLIMQTTAMGNGGEIYVLDMGEPVKISYLAEQMIKLSGKEPGEDIAITYTGIRPGEKLFEELFHEREKLEHTSHDKVLLASHRVVDWSILSNSFAIIEKACEEIDSAVLEQELAMLVPEYIGSIRRC